MADTPITLRLTIVDPVAGLHYSLQDKKNAPVNPVIAGDGPLSFDVPVRLSDDARMLGPFVRTEGPTRRFVYIAVGGQAGGEGLVVSRRAKIDVHDIPTDLLALARQGKVLEAVLPGRGKDGKPACATVRPLQPWRQL
ncbi:MAG: hypothetical protein JHC81_05930 [Brevundimonas sp.]|uniref:DUF5990 family protein n=1 Tax=Brevundimonas sp. TaxID=1871086 RepID=UPI001A2A8F71|nr:DUF5990 family protein [Brevundimonas sp.]MBJ7447056.1 hypothetical protein [Brevundimonas sp.]